MTTEVATRFRSHLLQLAPGVEIIVERLAGLDQLPATFTLAASPLRIQRGDGSRIRAVAQVGTVAAGVPDSTVPGA